jgi:four helix bundle protein
MSKFVDPPGLAEWEATLPATFLRDPIWRTPAYRFGLWLSHLAKNDFALLYAHPSSRNTAQQLLRAVEGISANLSEGYGRSTGRERARYYDYAQATTREARDWYFKALDVLGPEVVEQRLSVLERILRILAVVIPRERKVKVRPAPREIGLETPNRELNGSPAASSGSS